MTTTIAGITADTRKGLPAVRLLMVSLLRSNTPGMAVSRAVKVTVEEMLITAAVKEVTVGMTTTADLLNNRTTRLPMGAVAMMIVDTLVLVVIISLAVTTAETTRTALLLMAEEANREGTGVDLLEDTVAAMTKVLLLLALLLIKVDTTPINRAMVVHLNMEVAPRPMEVVTVVDTKSAVARSLRLIQNELGITYISVMNLCVRMWSYVTNARCACMVPWRTGLPWNRTSSATGLVT